MSVIVCIYSDRWKRNFCTRDDEFDEGHIHDGYVSKSHIYCTHALPTLIQSICDSDSPYCVPMVVLADYPIEFPLRHLNSGWGWSRNRTHAHKQVNVSIHRQSPSSHRCFMVKPWNSYFIPFIHSIFGRIAHSPFASTPRLSRFTYAHAHHISHMRSSTSLMRTFLRH